MIEYTWTISQLDAYPEHEGQENVVFTVHWRLLASDGTRVAEVYDATALTIDANASFTPFADLTKDQVIGWVEAAINAKAGGSERNPRPTVAELKEALAADIERQKTPAVVAPALPWA